MGVDPGSWNQGHGDDAAIQLRIQGQREARAAIQGTAKDLEALGKAADRTGTRMREGTRHSRALALSFGLMRRASQLAGVTVGTMFTGAAYAGLKFNATMEQNTIAMTRFLGSTKQAEEFLNWAYQLSVKGPFEFLDLAGASRKMMAFGLSAEMTKKTMTSLSDAIAGIGGGTDEIRRATIALGQIEAKGKVYGEELLQLGELGIPANKYLMEQLGLTRNSIARIGDLNIDSQTALTAIIKGMNKQFKGAAEEQNKTLIGQLSNMRDYSRQFLGRVLQPVSNWMEFEFLPPFIGGLNKASEHIRAGFGMHTIAKDFDEAFGAGGNLVKALDLINSTAHHLWAITHNNLLPTLEHLAWVVGVSLYGALIAVDTVLGFFADHSTTLNVILGIMIARWTLLNLELMWYNRGQAAAIALWIITRPLMWGMEAALLAMSVAQGAATAATWLFNAALWANPITWIVAAVLLLIAAVVLLVWKWDWVKGKLQQFWGWIRSHWAVLGAILFGPFGLAAGMIIDHWDDIVGFVRGMPGRLSRAGAGMWHWVTRLLDNALEAAYKKFWDFKNAITDFFDPGFSVNPLNYVPYGGQAQSMVQSGVVGGVKGAVGVVKAVNASDNAGLSKIIADAKAREGDTHIHVNVDGREVAKVVHKHNRDRVARG